MGAGLKRNVEGRLAEAQLVKCLPSARVMISQSWDGAHIGLPAPCSRILSLFLSLCPSGHSVLLSSSQINK